MAQIRGRDRVEGPSYQDRFADCWDEIGKQIQARPKGDGISGSDVYHDRRDEGRRESPR